MQKPSVPKGTRDFSALELKRRSAITEVIKKHFSNYGFDPIETPSFENLSTLTGKYGEEGDRLIFKILNSGDFIKKVNPEIKTSEDSKAWIKELSDKALRYDLTVPFARYVVQHQNEITFPFKRYQIQPVWRADRPQKGRFREFMQCDADVVGSTSLWQETELVLLYDAVFSELNVPVVIQFNNRKILSGLAEVAGIQDQIIDFTVALDKLDKIGIDKVKEEMRTRGISQEAIDIFEPIFTPADNFLDNLTILKKLLNHSKIGLEGIQEAETVYNNVKTVGLKKSEFSLNITLARGLDYYTGAIFEVVAKGVKMGSIGGGGRYANLTEIFGLKDMPGIGISFGLDRTYLVMEALNLFDDSFDYSNKVLFMNFGEKESQASFKLVHLLREQDIDAELYPDNVKLKKQFSYADKNQFSHVVMLGENEIEQDTLSLKNLKTGEQIDIAQNDLIPHLNKVLS